MLKGIWRAILISGEGIDVTGVLSRCRSSTQLLKGGQAMSRRRPNEVMKFMDDEGTSTPLGRLGDRISDSISLELNALR